MSWNSFLTLVTQVLLLVVAVGLMTTLVIFIYEIWGDDQ